MVGWAGTSIDLSRATWPSSCRCRPRPPVPRSPLRYAATAEGCTQRELGSRRVKERSENGATDGSQSVHPAAPASRASSAWAAPSSAASVDVAPAAALEPSASKHLQDSPHNQYCSRRNRHLRQASQTGRRATCASATPEASSRTRTQARRASPPARFAPSSPASPHSGPHLTK